MNRFNSVLVVAMLVSGVAAAQEGRPGWSVLSGKTLGEGSALHPEAGFPGVQLTLLNAIGPTVDIGGRVGFDYAQLSGDVSNFVGDVSLRGQFVARLKLVETAKLNFGLEFAPGLSILFIDDGPYVRMVLPIGARVGFPINDQLMIFAATDIPFWLQFTGGDGALGILFGGGVEYFLEPDLALTFNMRLGPIIGLGDLDTTDFGLNALIGFAFKM